MCQLEAVLNQLVGVREQLTDEEAITGLMRQLLDTVQPLDVNAAATELLLPTLPGIYYIEATFQFVNYEELVAFGDRWGRIRARDIEFKIPRFYPNRAIHHREALARREPIPFYLGKRENISDRVFNHLGCDLVSPTYALKLRARPELIEGVELSYSYKAFDVPLSAYYGVEIIESELRKVLNPILGKQ
jgi:hypothetical protein